MRGDGQGRRPQDRPQAVAGPGAPPLRIVRSTARRRTSSASARNGQIVVRVPAHLSAAAEREVVDDLMRRLHERAAAPVPTTTLPPSVAPRGTTGPTGPRGDLALVARADEVAARWLGGVRPASVAWSHRMTTRWASCTTPPGRIRVSHRLADAPDAVLDNILLHELAHIVETGHGPRFRALVADDPAAADVAAWLTGRTRAELRHALGLAPVRR